MPPAWVICPLCDDWACRIHDLHVADCPCPGIEDWLEQGVDPYDEGGPPEEEDRDDEIGGTPA